MFMHIYTYWMLCKYSYRGPKGPSPQGPMGAHKGLAHKSPGGAHNGLAHKGPEGPTRALSGKGPGGPTRARPTGAQADLQRPSH